MVASFRVTTWYFVLMSPWWRRNRSGDSVTCSNDMSYFHILCGCTYRHVLLFILQFSRIPAHWNSLWTISLFQKIILFLHFCDKIIQYKITKFEAQWKISIKFLEEISNFLIYWNEINFEMGGSNWKCFAERIKYFFFHQYIEIQDWTTFFSFESHIIPDHHRLYSIRGGKTQWKFEIWDLFKKLPNATETTRHNTWLDRLIWTIFQTMKIGTNIEIMIM